MNSSNKIIKAFFNMDNPGQRIKNFFYYQYIVVVILITIAGGIFGGVLGSNLGEEYADSIAYKKACDLYEENSYNNGSVSYWEIRNTVIYEQEFENSKLFLCPLLFIIGLIIFAPISFIVSAIFFWVPTIIPYAFGELVANNQNKNNKILGTSDIKSDSKNKPNSPNTFFTQNKKQTDSKINKESNRESVRHSKEMPSRHTKINNEFLEMTNEDLLLIFLDQKELYSESEIKQIEEVLLSRGIIEEDYYNDGNYIINEQSDYIDSILYKANK